MPGEAQNETVEAALLMLLAGEAGAAVSSPFIHTSKQDKPPQGKALVKLQKPSLEGRMDLVVDSQGQSSGSRPCLGPALGAEIKPPGMPKHRDTDHRLSSHRLQWLVNERIGFIAREPRRKQTILAVSPPTLSPTSGILHFLLKFYTG